MHPRPPNWFKRLKSTLLGLIYSMALVTITYTGYFLPIFLTQYRDVRDFSTIYDAGLKYCIFLGFFGAFQYLSVAVEYKLYCGILAVLNFVPSCLSWHVAVYSSPFILSHFWDDRILGQGYKWLFAVLYLLLTFAMVAYCLALVWLHYEVVQATAAAAAADNADGQIVVVIQNTATNVGFTSTGANPAEASSTSNVNTTAIVPSQ